MKYGNQNYDYINKKLHFCWWHFLYSTHNTNTLQLHHAQCHKTIDKQSSTKCNM